MPPEAPWDSRPACPASIPTHNAPRDRPAQHRAEQLLRSKPSPQAQEIYFGIPCVSHSHLDTVPKASATNRSTGALLAQGRCLWGRTYTSSPTCTSSFGSQMMLGCIVQVSTICPSNKKHQSPSFPMKRFPEQGWNYSSPQQGGEEKTCIIYPINTPTSLWEASISLHSSSLLSTAWASERASEKTLSYRRKKSSLQLLLSAAVREKQDELFANWRDSQKAGCDWKASVCNQHIGCNMETVTHKSLLKISHSLEEKPTVYLTQVINGTFILNPVQPLFPSHAEHEFKR